jgi:hypothetical protein
MHLSESEEKPKNFPLKKRVKDLFAPLFKSKNKILKKVHATELDKPRLLAKQVCSLYKETHLEKAKKLVQAFFIKATPSEQKSFFKLIPNESLLTQILLDLPKDLLTLNLSPCKHLSDSALIALTERLPKLEILEIEHCIDISDEGLSSFVGTLPSLKALNLTGCYAITDESLSTIAESSPRLLSLNLTGCYEITDKGLCTLAGHLENLQKLKIADCDLITYKGLDAFEGNLPDLQVTL